MIQLRDRAAQDRAEDEDQLVRVEAKLDMVLSFMRDCEPLLAIARRWAARFGG